MAWGLDGEAEAERIGAAVRVMRAAAAAEAAEWIETQFLEPNDGRA
jgi:hypothetical protein